MIKKIIVASSKGGVGKTTVALGIANALVKRKRSVLLFDLDFENRCLDMFMGIDEGYIYNIADVASGRIAAEKAVVRNGRGLSFVSAPATYDDETDALKGIFPGRLTAALSAVIESEKPDFVIFDTSAGLCVPALLASYFKGALAVTVASHQPASCKGAGRAAAALVERGAKDARLVISGYDTKSVKRDRRCGLLDIIDSSSVRLLGVVPYDKELMLSHERGVMAPENAPSTSAFDNIAARLCSENVKLFEGIKSSFGRNDF